MPGRSRLWARWILNNRETFFPACNDVEHLAVGTPNATLLVFWATVTLTSVLPAGQKCYTVPPPALEFWPPGVPRRHVKISEAVHAEAVRCSYRGDARARAAVGSDREGAFAADLDSRPHCSGPVRWIEAVRIREAGVPRGSAHACARPKRGGASASSYDRRRAFRWRRFRAAASNPTSNERSTDALPAPSSAASKSGTMYAPGRRRFACEFPAPDDCGAKITVCRGPLTSARG
jgi:hypothetical protein